MIINLVNITKEKRTQQSGQYIGSDNHIYLWFKPQYTYLVTFKLDSMRVGNGTLLEEGNVELIVSNQLQL